MQTHDDISFIKVLFGCLHYNFWALHGKTHAHALSKYFCVQCMSKFHIKWYTNVHDFLQYSSLPLN